MSNATTSPATANIPAQRVQPMRLLLRNGHPYPKKASAAEQENHSGNTGGVMLDITGVVHFEWLHVITVEFEDDEAFEHAQRTTGWKTWSYRVLEAQTSPADGYQHPAIIAANCAFCGFNLVPE
ncbi:MAG TPA: hypothetical protein PK677_15685 [Acidiphilium sp.]|uniref:hypothetical protein n=1 Tax=Acidiphilium sp. TaxID=527 RepID=UPI000BD38EC3|nr:hypothetical protein [Acidiphilium sp.]OZB38151.1 MAG: hypothetical protein B7X48_14345 [Acidiphilium sp. 34-60-192]HQT89956.1 hypothetical protein [Acidiphilium sp.]